MSNLPDESSPYTTAKLTAEEPEPTEQPSPYKTIKMVPEEPEEQNPAGSQ